MWWHAKSTLPLIGSPWQHSNASQSGRVFVPRKAALIWHKHVVDIPPLSPSPTTAIFEHVHVGYRCIYTHDLRVHMWALQAENNNISTAGKSPDESPQRDFRSLPKMVSQPVQLVSGFLVLVKMFLVPNRSGCLIKTLRDGSCVVSTSDSAPASSSMQVFVPLKFLWCWPQMSTFVL